MVTVSTNLVYHVSILTFAYNEENDEYKSDPDGNAFRYLLKTKLKFATHNGARDKTSGDHIHH